MQTRSLLTNQFFRFQAYLGQVLLVCAVVGVLCLMMLPLSAAHLDLFLSLNIVASLAVLMVVLFVPDPMRFSSFPTVLLMCTLFRLGLNIGSTRLILSRGEAGQIITTFAGFVTQGNVLVGFVVFVVLSLVQFLVISKGAERVAEVAARFTLDALPGKQMSIDADLRAGSINTSQAAKRRIQLIKESKFYGSMDGAMKFVKGDIIAGLCITFVNLCGGLLVGVIQQGLEVSQAATRYTTLTIGDGLVAQVPALLVSLAAGFLVTRVSDPSEPQSVGHEMGQQILREPTQLYVVSVVVLAIGLIPGLPLKLFLFLSLVFAVLGAVLQLRLREQHRSQQSIKSHLVCFDQPKGQAEPLLIELSTRLYQKFCADERWSELFATVFAKIRQHLSYQLGISLPEIKVFVNDGLSCGQYVIQIYEIPVEEGALEVQTAIVPQESSLHQRSQEEQLMRHVARVLVQHASDFVGIQQVRDLITRLEVSHSELVREVVPRMISVQKLTDVCRRLVEEGVSIKDFRLILETLSGLRPENKDPIELTELVRMGLKRVLTHKYVTDGRLRCFVLDEKLESLVETAICKNGSETYLALSCEDQKAITNALHKLFREHPIKKREAVVLTQPETRRFVRKVLESEFSEVAVLSYAELEPWVEAESLGCVQLNY